MVKKSEPFVTSELKAAADTFMDRNEIYGKAYVRHGKVMAALLPDGVSLRTDHDMARFAALDLIVSKLTRYASNFENGGHYDSLHDLSIYSAMLNDLDKNHG